MALPLKANFKPGLPIAAQLTADWCNTVAEYLNNLQGAGLTTVVKPTKPSRVTPVVIKTSSTAVAPLN